MEEDKELDATLELLHSIPHVIGEEGIIIDEELAKEQPCICIEHDGKELCWSPGVLGHLSPEQRDSICQVVEVPAPDIADKLTKWKYLVESCKEEMAELPKESPDRLREWVRCIYKGIKEEEKSTEV